MGRVKILTKKHGGITVISKLIIYFFITLYEYLFIKNGVINSQEHKILTTKMAFIVTNSYFAKTRYVF